MDINQTESKQQIILLSDLWGKEKSDWVKYYTDILSRYFEVIYYDSCDLGEIDKSDYSEENLHRQFVSGGIDKAANALLKKDSYSVNVLAFSIGGTIAWKAHFLGLKTNSIFSVSSTRLRYETQKPSGIIETIFGVNDAFKPDAQWFQKLEIKEISFENEGHELYQKKEIAEQVCQLIIKRIYSNLRSF